MPTYTHPFLVLDFVRMYLPTVCLSLIRVQVKRLIRFSNRFGSLSLAQR